MHIIFLSTGGTIDKDYPHAVSGWAFDFGDEAATTRLIRDRCSFPQPSFSYEIESVCRKDSLEIINEDREDMWQAILRHVQVARNSERERSLGFVITHGTDTLLDTARYLQEKQSQEQKEDLVRKARIVLTGAMRPERFSNSDAPINFGMAVAAVQLIANDGIAQPVVYVAMHGIVKPVNDIQRNTESGQFY